MPKAGKILADLNIAEFIKDMGLAVAEAQQKLDENSVNQTLRLGQTVLPGMTQNLLELGLQPAFYHFQYADLEVHLNVYYSTEVDFGVNFNLDREDESSSYDLETEASSGTATITVQDGEGIPPVGRVALKANQPGQLTIGNASYVLSDGSSPGTGQPIALQPSLQESAQALLLGIRDDSVWTHQAQGDLQGVFMEWVSKSGVTASTNRPDLYVCNGPVITVRSASAGPSGDNFVVARLDSVNPVPELKLPDNNPSPLTSNKPSVAEALEEIGGQIDANACVLVSGGACNRALFFDTNEHEAPDDYGNPHPEVTLDAVAALLAAYPSARVSLVGWADKRATEAYNQALSSRRAESVKRALVSRGVAASRIDAVGRGETDRFSTSDLAENRRVELTFSGLGDVLVARTPEASAAWAPASGSSREAQIVPRTRAPGASPPAPVVTFRGHDYKQGVDFNPGATPASTAENLAAAIRTTSASTAFGAFANGDRVYLYGPGDYALYTLFAKTATAPTLSAAGSVRVAEPFGNGRPPATPQVRDTLVIESVQLVAVSPGSTPQANEFALGVSAAETAQNLADAINAASTAGTLPAGMRAQAAGNTVTLTGPAGTLLGTSNRNAFLLSGPRIGGRSSTNRSESSARQLRALNLDAHLSVKHELNVSGSSTIKARLVAVPAPPQFLQAIGDYLQRWYP